MQGNNAVPTLPQVFEHDSVAGVYVRACCLLQCRSHVLSCAVDVCRQVIESYSYFSLSVAMTLYLTDEFGVSDLSVRSPYLHAQPRIRSRQEVQLAADALFPQQGLRIVLQAGFYYGMWGMMATLYGFAFGGVVDWLGARPA